MQKKAQIKSLEPGTILIKARSWPCLGMPTSVKYKLGPMGINTKDMTTQFINASLPRWKRIKVHFEIRKGKGPKKFDLVLTPSVSDYILLEMRGVAAKSRSKTKGLKGGYGKSGFLTFKQVLALACWNMGRGKTMARSLKAAVKEILGTCVKLYSSVVVKDGGQKFRVWPEQLTEIVEKDGLEMEELSETEYLSILKRFGEKKEKPKLDRVDVFERFGLEKKFAVVKNEKPKDKLEKMRKMIEALRVKKRGDKKN